MLCPSLLEVCIFNFFVTTLISKFNTLQIAHTLEVGIPLRFQVYRGNFGIENALIAKANRGCSNAVLHVINHVLHPAEESLEYILRREGNFR